jgi:hypothetical protein
LCPFTVRWPSPEGYIHSGDSERVLARLGIEIQTIVGYPMIRNKAFLFVALLAAFALSSCSGLPGGGCVANCGGGTGSVSVTVVSDTLPTNPSLISFPVVVEGITLVSASGNQTLTLASPMTVDLMRIQSDSAFLGTFASVPAAQYTGISLTISSASVSFYNDTGSTITTATSGGNNCNSTATCTSNGSAAVVTATFNYTVSGNAVTGIAFDIDLANTISLTGASLVTLNASNVASAFTLPRSGGNFTSSQFDLIEDFTGVASVNGNIVTVVSPTRGTLTATANSNTVYDQDPSGTLCVSQTTLSGCVTTSNEVVSMDAVLNSDGTLSIQEIEPLLAAPSDTVEGVILALPNSQTQFGIVVTDIPSESTTNSLIGSSLHVGDLFAVNLTSANTFEVDNKGLAISGFGSITNFLGQNTTSAMHFGETVAVHITSFTAATASTFATANTDSVVLRWSHLTATASIQGTTNVLNIDNLPSYFGISPATSFVVELFPGTQGTPGVTNFDGVTTGTGVASSQPVAIRALYLQNAGNSANPAFFAAKVRVP